MKALTETKPSERISLASHISQQRTVTRAARFRQKMRRWWPFYVMALPGVIYFFIWHYLPIWETKIAFEQYRIIPPNIWVGMQYFTTLMSSPVFWQVIQNTVIIGAMKLVFIFPVPIILALLLNEVRSSGYRKFVQSVIYLPHYLSWVVIASIAIATLSPVDGAINDVIKSMGYDPIPFMTDTGTIRWVLVFTEMWRSAGWDSLLYIAAILAIDPQLYEAAEMDGANGWQVLTRYQGFTHIQCKLKTGRTHQIRVHMASIGHPLAGDEVYGPRAVIKKLGGQCLHAKTLGFVHPISGKYMEFDSPLPDYFLKFLSSLKKEEP